MLPRLSWNPTECAHDAGCASHLRLADVLLRAKALGLQWVELAYALIPSCSATTVAPLRQLLDRLELAVSAVSLSCDFIDLDPEVRRSEIERALAWASVARALGSTGLRLAVGRIPVGCEQSQAETWALDGLCRVADVTAALGVDLGLENACPDRGAAFEDLWAQQELFLSLAAATADSAVGIVLNTSNLVGPENVRQAVLELLGNRVWSVCVTLRQVENRAGTAESQDELQAVLGLLSSHGYKGYITLDGHGWDGDASVAEALRSLRQAALQWWL